MRACIRELLPEALDGTVDASPVFDPAVGLEGVPGDYKATDEHTALKAPVTN